MKNTSVTLTLNVNVNRKNKTDVEQSVKNLLDGFLDGFTDEFDGCKINEYTLNVESQYTNGVSVPNYVAEYIELQDDEQEKGGISHVGETLDEFIQELSIEFEEYGAYSDDKFIYSIPLGVVNGALNECGIKMISNREWDEYVEKAIAKLSEKY